MLGQKRSTRARKKAAQARSRATVAALVEATARILVREGFDRASTNRIAEEAGVSIGSLYQYFPGKEALVAAVIERHNHDLMQVVRQAMAEAEREPIGVGIDCLVAAAIEAHRVHPALHRVLAEQTPRTGELEGVELFHREALNLFRAYLEDHRDALVVTDLDLAAFICVTSIEALTHSAVIHRPKILSGEARQRLVAETSRMIAAYLGVRGGS
ncbi:TetR/AcrR family transcriptional regulator [Sphingopyxis flava]|uniref:Transcriptional regulator, TetR family n=1 Tax=Sphingopyxis flava TaxID=1507287 RepID=A0A1T5DNB8_9SPHN|nr:TetR/AcrR family transcriptional regulator [Sphingopyxis flava]SKB73101.1 transcriptional regulator, TetR family [Sphingopyxis flava]